MRASLVVAALILGLIASPRADASPLYYTLTDLGTSDTLQTDANGYTYGVTNTAGTVTYALDKSPVVMTIGPTTESWPSGLVYSQVTTFQTQGGSYSVTTNWWPLSPGFQTGSSVEPGELFGKVTDANVQGEMIGQTNGGGALGVIGIHGVVTGYGSMLTTDDYTAPSTLPFPDFYFTGGQLIDDLGRILAHASDGHQYLLTPTSLGAPQTVPEPSTLLIFGLAAAALMSYRAHRARRRGPLSR